MFVDMCCAYCACVAFLLQNLEPDFWHTHLCCLNNAISTGLLASSRIARFEELCDLQFTVVELVLELSCFKTNSSGSICVILLNGKHHVL